MVGSSLPPGGLSGQAARGNHAEPSLSVMAVDPQSTTQHQPQAQLPGLQPPVGQQPPLGGQQAIVQQIGQQPLAHQQLPGLQPPVGQQPPLGGHQAIGQQRIDQQWIGQQPLGQQWIGQQPLGQQWIGQQPLGQQPLGQQPGPYNAALAQQPLGQQQLPVYQQAQHLMPGQQPAQGYNIGVPQAMGGQQQGYYPGIQPIQNQANLAPQAQVPPPLFHGPPPAPYIAGPGGIQLPVYQPGNQASIAMALHASPLDANVDDKTKEQIFCAKYIEFADLLRNKASDSVVVTQLSEDGHAETHSLVLPGSQRKDRLTYNQWQKAFYVYAAVHIPSHNVASASTSQASGSDTGDMKQLILLLGLVANRSIQGPPI